MICPSVLQWLSKMAVPITCNGLLSRSSRRSGGAAAHVQPPIIENKWRIIVGRLLRQTIHELVAQIFRGKIPEVTVKDDVANELAIVSGIVERGGGSLG